jgi:F-type H+-transporting ATPase subunit gamma
MKMVSAAKLRRAQERALAARPFAKMLTNVLKSLVSRAEIYDPETGAPKHPLLERRQENNILLLVVTGDKGLAGAFNANLLKATMRFIESKAGRNIDLIAFGRKGRDFLRRRFPVAEKGITERKGPIQIVGEHVGMLGKADFEYANELAQGVIDRYIEGRIDSVYLVFNEFKSVISQRLVVETILPVAAIGELEVAQVEELTPEQREQAAEAAVRAGVSVVAEDTREIDEKARQFGTAQVDYIYEQPPAELFAALLPRYIAVEVFHSMLESWAAFNAAQMTAMDSATNNASEMIDSLTLAMNRARQASITKEIIEIVSGAAAL